MKANEPPLINDLKDLVGQTVTLWCSRYIYHGMVAAVNDTYITLENAGIVYETGKLNAREPEDLQELPGECHVMVQSIESIIQLKW